MKSANQGVKKNLPKNFWVWLEDKSTDLFIHPGLGLVCWLMTVIGSPPQVLIGETEIT